MRIHHLNCATQCILGGRLVGGRGPLWHRTELVCHCLLIETDSGLVLVDTGLGLQDIAHPHQRLGHPFLMLAQPHLHPEETALRQIEQLGFSSRDVRHIILTHLDLDHAGGLADFPHATVHLLEAEYQTAVALTGSDKASQWFQQIRHGYRYRPLQWSHQPQWVRYQTQGESWFGFECVRQLQGLSPEILLVPLIGHTAGHTGVAVQTQKGWLLHAGDAYYHHNEMHPTSPTCPPGLSFIQWTGAIDVQAFRQNQQRIRQLRQEQTGSLQLFSAHDPTEFKHAEESNY
jgi:glyoxylase-like metal-dependent hydrolase (beta-lactamase superfamily II)